MDTYSLLREFADSWMLLFLFCFFIGVVVWAFWPGLKRDRDEAANIPFLYEGETDFQKEAENG